MQNPFDENESVSSGTPGLSPIQIRSSSVDQIRQNASSQPRRDQNNTSQMGDQLNISLDVLLDKTLKRRDNITDLAPGQLDVVLCLID
mmetsp:Transcript_17540/g.23104  ORF Transcript_17540/g.23104 Transcript_17540/m.23104 type:complete len:88 (+) Transcript_17540:1668-1931(+)